MKYIILFIIALVGRLRAELPDDYGKLAYDYIPTGGSALESSTWS